MSVSDRNWLAESESETSADQRRVFSGIGPTYDDAVKNAFTLAEREFGEGNLVSVQVVHHHGRAGGSWSDHKIMVVATVN
jgi:hypothetical protein